MCARTYTGDSKKELNVYMINNIHHTDKGSTTTVRRQFNSP